MSSLHARIFRRNLKRIIPFFTHLLATLVICTVSSYSKCDDIYGGGWSLVRHSYNSWHPATDNLAGIDEYGFYDNDPKSTNTWSIPFDYLLSYDGSAIFMFSDGDCSQYLITQNNQFTSTFSTKFDATIISSNYGNNYQSEWYNRPTNNEQDPMISWMDNNESSLLYVENNDTQFVTRFNNLDKWVNVWISYVFYICVIF